MLKTVVKISNVTNLSDARYCAGMGVEMLGFSIDEAAETYVDLKKFNDIRSWIAGVQIVAAGRSVPDSVHYLLEGKLSRGGFGGQIPFRHEGRLSPVPGVPGGWR